MIKHIVMLDLPADYNKQALAEIMLGFDAFRGELEGFLEFEHGPNLDFEDMSPQCAYAFICTFESKDVSRAYIVHPTHAELGMKLVDLCNGGVNGITVVDMALPG